MPAVLVKYVLYVECNDNSNIPFLLIAGFMPCLMNLKLCTDIDLQPCGCECNCFDYKRLRYQGFYKTVTAWIQGVMVWLQKLIYGPLELN